jgi:hypothetical protein
MIELSEEFESLLGKVHDTEIARKYGVSRSKVVKDRNSRGIAACKEPRRKPRVPPPGMLEKLGKQSDHSLALQFGVSYYYVNQLRRSLDIPSFTESKTHVNY